MRAAIIDNDTVVNIVEAHEAFAAEQGWVVTDDAQIGWSYAAGEFSPPPEPTISESQLNDLLNTERERRVAIGSSFPVPGLSTLVPLTGRPFDQTVYLALLTRASGYKALGIVDPVLKIRDGADMIHMLTPDQMIALVSQGMSWFESVMAASWAMKDGATPYEDGIPADFADDEHWPV